MSFPLRIAVRTTPGALASAVRCDDGDADRDREVAEFVEHADGGVVTATDDRHHDEQVDVRVGAVITTSDRAVEDDAAGTAALNDPVGDA